MARQCSDRTRLRAGFGYLALELVALGAPPSLVEASHSDALDEIRHARICYGIARAFDGRDVGPAPFAAALLPLERPCTLRAVCTEALKEAAWLELASAKVLAQLAARSDVAAPIRDALRGIAVDEARHAAHGRELVRWCIEREGAELAHEMIAVCTEWDLAAHMPKLPGGMQAYGLADAAMWRECLQSARMQLRAWLENSASQEERFVA